MGLLLVNTNINQFVCREKSVIYIFPVLAMKRFLFNILAFGLPLWILGVIYCITDVFKVIHHYDSYYNDSYYIDINRSYGSTMTYVNQNPKYNYNSFIFGNSRSIFYEVETWKIYLPNESRCMHFD